MASLDTTHLAIRHRHAAKSRFVPARIVEERDEETQVEMTTMNTARKMNKIINGRKTGTKRRSSDVPWEGRGTTIARAENMSKGAKRKLRRIMGDKLQTRQTFHNQSQRSQTRQTRQTRRSPPRPNRPATSSVSAPTSPSSSSSSSFRTHSTKRSPPLRTRNALIITDSNGRGATTNAVLSHIPDNEKGGLNIDITTLYTIEEAYYRIKRGDVKVEGKIVVVDCVTNSIRGRGGRLRTTPREISREMKILLDVIKDKKALAITVCEVKPIRHLDVSLHNTSLRDLYRREAIYERSTEITMKDLTHDGFHVKSGCDDLTNKAYARAIQKHLPPKPAPPSPLNANDATKFNRREVREKATETVTSGRISANLAARLGEYVANVVPTLHSSPSRDSYPEAGYMTSSDDSSSSDDDDRAPIRRHRS